MTSIGGVDLGEVKSESSTKSSGIFNTALPFSDSETALIMDLLGTSRTISIEGIKTGTVSQLRTFVTNLEALQNGQQSGMTFVSSWTNADKTVLIQDFTHTKVEGDESRVTYTLTLIEGTAL